MILFDNAGAAWRSQASAREGFVWSALPATKVTTMKKKKNHSSDFPDGSASVVIVEEDGLILAVSRRDNHSDLGLPGGKIETGETAITAACREAVEETGCILCNPQLAGIADVGSIKVFIYRAEIFGSVSEFVNSEGALVKWVKPEEICSGSFGKFNTDFILPVIAK
jgi:ADP-ribose pyrophosphatase YjhB (NUDIX family)